MVILTQDRSQIIFNPTRISLIRPENRFIGCFQENFFRVIGQYSTPLEAEQVLKDMFSKASREAGSECYFEMP